MPNPWREYGNFVQMKKKWLSCLIGLLFAHSTWAAPERVPVSAFAEHSLEGWQHESFTGNTEYTLHADQGAWFLRAKSQQSASGLYQKVSIDLTQTPYLEWRWQVIQRVGSQNETLPGQDDYNARLLLSQEHPFFPWKSKTISYVWSNGLKQGDQWQWKSRNGYVIKLLAVRDGTAPTGQWLTERRNVQADFKRLFGVEVNRISVVGIVSDSDDTKTASEVWYGDLVFRAK